MIQVTNLNYFTCTSRIYKERSFRLISRLQLLESTVAHIQAYLNTLLRPNYALHLLVHLYTNMYIENLLLTDSKL